MGFLSGGTADKLGNRYEGRWVVQQLLYLLAERRRSVQLEAIGDAEEGVDLWVTRLDTTPEAQQCKAFNASKVSWSISDLRSRNVVTKAYSQLTRDPRAEFSFVSSVPAAELEDLTRNARDSSDQNSFYDHCVKGKPRQSAFDALCRALGLVPSEAEGQERLFDFLRRVHVRIFQDDRHTRDQLEFMASMLLEGGTPASAIAALADIAQNNLHRELTAPVLVQLLQPYDLRIRARHADQLTTSRLDLLWEAFIDSIKPQLAAGKLIKRAETDEVLTLLETNSKLDAIVIHGAPGHGKSGVLYQIALALRESGVLVMAVRLDRQPPTALNTTSYGQQLGLHTSPVTALCDLAVGQPAVLILDQLDALRWTNAHAEKGLDVCKALLREVQAARRLGAKIDIILACRTFDLEHDPEIKSWLTNKASPLRVAKIEVKSLPREVVRAMVTAAGIDPDLLKPKQLGLLESVQRLAMWIEITASEAKSPVFDSSTQLLRHFWRNRRTVLEKAGCDPARRDQVIESLVEHMETNACLTAPARVLGQDQKLITELQSCGVVSIRDHTVSFGHQSNLDFLIADRAITKMNADGRTVLQWLGGRQLHSLFRREQLRQVLFLLTDEDHARYLKSVQQLLTASDVRFHLRQLAIETLSQIQPARTTFDFVFGLLADEQWREHVEFHVIHGNDRYISELVARDQLLPMLLSTDSQRWGRAAAWLTSVRQTCPSLVASEASRIEASSQQWMPRVEAIVGRDGIDTEADELFELRLKCLMNGSESPYVEWVGMAKAHPDRAVRLYHAMLVGAMVNTTVPLGRRNAVHFDRKNDVTALCNAVSKRSQLAWKLLWPTFRQLVREHRAWRQEWLKQPVYVPREQRISVPAGLRQIVSAAGRAIARRSPSSMLRIAQCRTVLRSRTLSSLFVELLASVPASFADQTIAWLLHDGRLLRCGNSRRRPRWAPARALIRRRSPHCSDARFHELEDALLRFRDPEEKRLAVYWLQSTRNGEFRNGFGMGQHYLLPALCRHRRSADTTDRIGVLERKFDTYPRHVFFFGLTRGGFGAVRSPLDDDRRFERMSDKAWRQVIENKSTLSRRGTWHAARGRPGWVESSVELLSRSFGRAARIVPERFARLASSLPADTHADYISELLNALTLVRPPNDVSETKRDQWTPATPESIGLALSRLPLSNDRTVARAYCWLLQGRDDLDISDAILEQLLHYAAHPEPDADELIVASNEKASGCSVETLEQNAHNAVRATAALAIASILWRRPDLLPQLAATIEKLIKDDHPVVRLAAVEICLPVLKIDRPKAFQWFVVAASPDLRVAASGMARRLYNNGFKDFSHLLTPLVRGMMDSNIDEVAEEGAAEVFARWLFHGLFADEVPKCLSGSPPQRKGIAGVASQLILDPTYTDRCLPELKRFFDDEVKNVRQAAAISLYEHETLELPWAPDVLAAFINSKAFRDDDGQLLWRLKDLPIPIERFSDAIFGIVAVVVERIQARASNNPEATYWNVDGLVALLLRLYDRATGTEQDEIRQRCLDAWDYLIENRATVAWALTRGMDEVA